MSITEQIEKQIKQLIKAGLTPKMIIMNNITMSELALEVLKKTSISIDVTFLGVNITSFLGLPVKDSIKVEGFLIGV